MTRMKKCKPAEHVDRAVRGGSRVKCETCRDEFPCRRECIHVDCMIATGRAAPDWIVIR